MDDLLGRVKIRRDQLQHSALAFLIILMEEHSNAAEVYRTYLDKETIVIEQQTRMTSLNVGFGDRSMDTDYETLTRRIHGCNTNLIFLDHVLEFEQRLADFCKQAYSKFWEIRRREQLDDLPPQQHEEFYQAIDYNLNHSVLRRSQAQSLQKRVQSQMSVVSRPLDLNSVHTAAPNGVDALLQVYSIISQRDSRINLLVAEESRKIAQATMHDSKAMKLIALLTLVFLPATMMAV